MFFTFISTKWDFSTLRLFFHNSQTFTFDVHCGAILSVSLWPFIHGCTFVSLENPSSSAGHRRIESRTWTRVISNKLDILFYFVFIFLPPLWRGDIFAGSFIGALEDFHDFLEVFIYTHCRPWHLIKTQKLFDNGSCCRHGWNNSSGVEKSTWIQGRKKTFLINLNLNDLFCDFICTKI